MDSFRAAFAKRATAVFVKKKEKEGFKKNP